MTKREPAKKQQPWWARFISSDYFFWGVVFLFILNSLWIVLSTIYPMMFDEEFHLGIIEIYSHQLSPFIVNQAPETVFHGDLTRNSSYLYHYLMSFPLRITTLITQDLITQIIILRIINVTLVAVSLWLFRKVLLLGGFSKVLTHLSVLFFTLIPLVPFTAAQINYDNLIMIFTAGIFFTALKTIQKSPQQVMWLMSTLSIGLLGSLIKFTFLPVFLAAFCFIFFSLWKQYRQNLLQLLTKQYKTFSISVKTLFVIAIIISAGLFTERYGINIVQYHSLEPSCDQVHSKELCSQYNVWQRNTSLREEYQKRRWPLWRPIEYTYNRWVPHIFNDLFVSGAYTGGEVGLRKQLGHLEATAGNKIIRATSQAVAVAALIMTIIFWRRLKLKSVRYLFLSSIGFYALALWFKNYTDYLAYGVPVATQGRYFIPFLIPLMAMAGYSFSAAIKRQYIKGVLLAVTLLLFTQGAGATTYILYSNEKWYWPENQIVKTTNQNVKEILKRVIFRY